MTTIFTMLSSCDACAVLLYMRPFNRVVIGDVANASGKEQLIRDKGVQVDILEDQKGIALYAEYPHGKPDGYRRPERFGRGAQVCSTS